MTLTFDSISLRFGMRDILSSIYMRCATGQIVGLLGRNGSGKSCLMKIVFGSMSAEFKSIRIDDQPLPPNYLGQKQIAYLPQERMIPGWLTISKALKLFNVDPKEIVSLFPEAIDLLDLRPRELSGGCLRIIETLMILKSNASFCLLDEPFSGLMPIHIDRMKDVLRKVGPAKGIIMTDHLYRHITDVADELYVLVNGKTYPISESNQLIRYGYVGKL